MAKSKFDKFKSQLLADLNSHGFTYNGVPVTFKEATNFIKMGNHYVLVVTKSSSGVPYCYFYDASFYKGPIKLRKDGTYRKDDVLEGVQQVIVKLEEEEKERAEKKAHKATRKVFSDLVKLYFDVDVPRDYDKPLDRFLFLHGIDQLAQHDEVIDYISDPDAYYNLVIGAVFLALAENREVRFSHNRMELDPSGYITLFDQLLSKSELLRYVKIYSCVIDGVGMF